MDNKPEDQAKASTNAVWEKYASRIRYLNDNPTETNFKVKSKKKNKTFATNASIIAAVVALLYLGGPFIMRQVDKDAENQLNQVRPTIEMIEETKRREAVQNQSITQETVEQTKTKEEKPGVLETYFESLKKEIQDFKNQSPDTNVVNDNPTAQTLTQVRNKEAVEEAIRAANQQSPYDTGDLEAQSLAVQRNLDQQNFRKER